MKRRTFLQNCTALALPGICKRGAPHSTSRRSIAPRVLERCEEVSRGDKPATVTAAHSTSQRWRAATHFFSEGDYWWPDPKKPGWPVRATRRHDQSRQFCGHRKFLLKLGTNARPGCGLEAQSKERRLRTTPRRICGRGLLTRPRVINPDLQYAQAIHGKSTGRGTGRDRHHPSGGSGPRGSGSSGVGCILAADFAKVKKWFADYANWMTTSKNGMEERDAKNNHGTCWLMQVAAFAKLTDDKKLMAYSADRFKTVIVPGQIEPDGSLPLEMRRTKPYGYCLFNLEALSTLCQIVSETGDNLWNFATPDGRGVRKAIEYMYPYIKDKKTWPKPPDVMYFEYWPMRQEALLFGGLAYKRADYIDVWKKCRPIPTSTR